MAIRKHYKPAGISAAFLALFLMLTGRGAHAAEIGSRISVHPSRIISHLSPYMYGSCIEDVNHEIYGGLYAQQIFGESFEEPPVSLLPGWAAYGGDWRITGRHIAVDASAGAKLVRSQTQFANGSVSCDIRFPDAQGGNAGLILRVSDARTGADTWIGYEVSLSVSSQTLILGSHRNNWQPLRTAAVHLQTGRWIHLRVDLHGPVLQIYVGNVQTPQLTYNDAPHAIPSGAAGLRTWNSHAEFRNFVVAAQGKTIAANLNSVADHKPYAISGMWDAVVTGTAQAGFKWDARRAYNSAHSQQILFASGKGRVGIANRGLNRWGIAVHRGRAMQGHLYLLGRQGSTVVTVALQSANGTRTYAMQKLAAAGPVWKRFTFLLHPSASDANARFAIWLSHPGRVNVDQAYLSGTGAALFHGGPFRADIGRMLVQEGLTFLRYGGSMVNSPGYQWRSMTGPPGRRPQYNGTWYPYSTNGFAIPEFLQFCQAAHIEPAFAINIHETAADAANMLHYLCDPRTTLWGAKRAADGHPAPYRVDYIEIGNEEAINGSAAWYAEYLKRFEVLYSAMRRVNRHVKFIIAAWWRADDPWCEKIAKALNGKAALWDIHVGGDNLRDAEQVDSTLTQMQQLFAHWIPGSSMKACILEENGGLHNMQRALGHARILNVVMRHGDFVRIDCPANCLQPYHENDNGWDQGQVFFLPNEVWGMPPYYAQQMAALNKEPLCVDCQMVSPNSDMDVTAARSAGGRTLVLQVVNSGSMPHTAQIQTGGFALHRQVEVWVLSGPLAAVNTPRHPHRVTWHKTVAKLAGVPMHYTFLPYSYTILRFRKR